MAADATLVTLRKDVAKVLKEKDFGDRPFTIRETYTFEETLEETDHLNLLVGFSSWALEKSTRTTRWHDYEIDVGAQYRFATKDGQNVPLEKLDELMLLMQDLADYFWNTRPVLSDCFMLGVQVGGPVPGQPYVPQHLITHKQFTGVLRLQFRKER